jgi:phosphoglycolate phosphatase
MFIGNTMDAFKKKDQTLTVKSVIFDFDGTLAVLNIDFSSMREEVFDLMKGYDIVEEFIKEKYLLEMIDEACQIIWKKNPTGAEDFYQKAHQILHKIEMEAADKGRLFPGTKITLKSLRGKGIKIGIITRNCKDAVRKVFPDIEDFCDIFVPRDFQKKVKPHPDHLTYVMESLKTSAEKAWMVGDHPIDIQAGKRVGMKTIGVLTGRTRKEEFENAGADYILREVFEINELLE